MAHISNLFAHIFIHYYSNKTSSACKLFISEPTQNQERLLGRLFGILEINTPSRENNQLINHLIANLEDIYYSYAENENLDPAECFENTLKEVNQKFIQLIRNKEISLVGNLNENTIREKINLAIGVMKDSQIHISYLNNINLFLIHKTKQDYKLIDIKKIAQGENADAQTKDNTSLFGNLISGEANPPDYLILANANFLEYISLERIQKIITSLPLHKATEYFKNSLLQFEGQNFAAILIKNSFDEAEPNKEPASLTSITELNSTESATEKLLAPSFWNIIKAVPEEIIKYFNLFRTTSDPDKQSIESEKSVSAESNLENSNLSTKKKNSTPLKNYFFRLKKPIKQFFIRNNFINNLKNKLNFKFSIWRNKLRTVPNFSKILLGIAGILLVLFTFSIIYFKQQQGQTINQKDYQNLISQIEDKKNQAESDLIYGNEDKAKTSIAQAQALLATLPVESKKEKDTYEALNGEILKIVAKLRHITVIENPNLIADLANSQENNVNIQNIIYQNNSITAFNSANNSNYQVDLSTNSVSQNVSNLSDMGAILKARIIENNIAIYTAGNNFVTFKDGKYTPISVSLPANAILADFADYNGRLYVTDTISNQIYRLAKNDTGYDQGLTWLKSAQDLKDIIAMSIDTSIWLLDKKGLVLKFTKGNKQAFEIKNLDPILESPTRLFTNDQTNFIYILEPKQKRIVVLDKTGNMAAQYYSDTFNNLQDFSLDETNKKIYIANDNKIYSFNLSHLQ